MQINVIEPYQVDFFWPSIARYIEAAQKQPAADFTADEILDQCRRDESWRLLIIDHFDAAIVVRILGDDLYVVSIGGHMEPGWHLEFFDWLKKTAQILGLRSIAGGGRKGWIRLLAPLGFKVADGLLLRCEVPELEVETP